MKSRAHQVVGFSLIELMIVVAIIAILAAIALPSFGRYAYRARRADSQELLLRIANAQERFYTTNNHYGSLGELGYNTPALSEKGHYSVSVEPAGASTTQVYKLTAKPVGVQNNDVCGDMSIDDAGRKLPLATETDKNTNGSCW